MHLTTEDFETTLNALMTQIIGLALGSLLTGILISLGISSLFLLSSRKGDRSLLRQNRLFSAYIITSLSAVLALEAGVFVAIKDATASELFSQPQNTYRQLEGIWNRVAMAVIILSADGVLVCLSY